MSVVVSNDEVFSFSSGVQVVRAHPGSLVLDVALTHADTVTPKQAFEIFTEEVLKASPSTTRVQNILKVYSIFHFFLRDVTAHHIPENLLSTLKITSYHLLRRISARVLSLLLCKSLSIPPECLSVLLFH